MAQFVDPFVVDTPDGKMSPREAARATRQAIAAEHEAVHLYEAIADATDDERVKKVMQDIANEEKVHVHEFQVLLALLDKDEAESKKEGEKEVDELLKVEPEPEEETTNPGEEGEGEEEEEEPKEAEAKKPLTFMDILSRQ